MALRGRSVAAGQEGNRDPSGEERKQRAAGAVVVRRGADGWRYLLLRVYRNWDFPKGRIEAGEDPLAAAVREVAEESGLDDLAFPWGEDFAETAPYARGKVARYYLAESPAARAWLPVNPALGRPEHYELRWVAAGEARALLPDRLQSILAWARARVESG